MGEIAPSFLSHQKTLCLSQVLNPLGGGVIYFLSRLVVKSKGEDSHMFLNVWQQTLSTWYLKQEKTCHTTENTFHNNNLKMETKVEPPQTAQLLPSQVILLHSMAFHPDLETLMESSHRKL